MRTRFRGTVLDAPFDGAIVLARFYAELLGWTVTDQAEGERGTWAMVESGTGLKLEFQGLADYQRPVWPNADGQQQMMLHLDIAVDDMDAAIARALELGARLADVQPQPHVKVMLDPAGHPFCLFVGQV